MDNKNTFNKSRLVKCKGTKDGKVCNNPICVQNGKKVIMKRHNREIHIILFDGQNIEIICEKCGNKTVIRG